MVGIGSKVDEKYVWILERPVVRYPSRRSTRTENNITDKRERKIYK